MPCLVLMETREGIRFSGTVISHHVSAGNQTMVLCKNSKCSLFSSPTDVVMPSPRTHWIDICVCSVLGALLQVPTTLSLDASATVESHERKIMWHLKEENLTEDACWCVCGGGGITSPMGVVFFWICY